jgi:hypothetical protein
MENTGALRVGKEIENVNSPFSAWIETHYSFYVESMMEILVIKKEIAGRMNTY